VLVHSDQGSPYTSDDRQSFLKAHGMGASMSRRGNCHDNAVAESFFSLLKKERIKCRIYPDRAAVLQPGSSTWLTADLSSVEFKRLYAKAGS
jgi:putative transposase